VTTQLPIQKSQLANILDLEKVRDFLAMFGVDLIMRSKPN